MAAVLSTLNKCNITKHNPLWLDLSIYKDVSLRSLNRWNLI